MAVSREPHACRHRDQGSRDPVSSPLQIDVERLVWDVEYRDEVRLYLKCEAKALKAA